MSLLTEAKAFRTKKSLGQNFLVSEEHLGRIINSINSPAGKTILEIGPGIGFLTNLLLHNNAKVIALDFDDQALDKIKNHPNLHKIHADALRADFNTLDFVSDAKDDHSNPVSNKPSIVVGNLPFNVGTQILLRFIGEINQPEWSVQGIEEMILMFQYEVAERITAKPSCKAYNPLSLVIQAKSEVEFLFKVPAKYFCPIPKVDAGVIRIKPLKNGPLKGLSQQHLDNLQKTIRKAFSTRRKNLKNALSGLFIPEEIIASGIEPTLRAENLGLDSFVNLASILSSRGS